MTRSAPKFALSSIFSANERRFLTSSMIGRSSTPSGSGEIFHNHAMNIVLLRVLRETRRPLKFPFSLFSRSDPYKEIITKYTGYVIDSRKSDGAICGMSAYVCTSRASNRRETNVKGTSWVGRD